MDKQELVASFLTTGQKALCVAFSIVDFPFILAVVAATNGMLTDDL
jgi:hypothetical protein